ncbi:MAG: acyl-CoA dehydratase activase [Oscillospiraceae bacterium]|nr:acyl-CoA dehydratase activase [Oscillospiraceae bacterium]
MQIQRSLGVDVGSISTKGVLLDEGGEIAAQAYLWTEGDPVGAVQRLLRELMRDMPAEAGITAVGTTGSARKLVGAMLEATVVKNEITAHAVGTLAKCPDVRTILEIGGQDAKMILLENGVVVDYAMNTLCAAGTGAFLTSQAKRLGLNVEEMGEWALRSRSPAKIAARCTVFAETDMVHKAQVGVSKEDLVAGLCAAVVSNYLNNVGKGKKIAPPRCLSGRGEQKRGGRRRLRKGAGAAGCCSGKRAPDGGARRCAAGPAGGRRQMPAAGYRGDLL